jgi:hypothetical protein
MPMHRVPQVVKDVYVSDADVEMSKDVESIRIDRHLVADLSAVMPGRRRKMVDRIEEHARKNLIAVMPLLAKYYNHESPKVRSQIRASLARLMATEAGEQALIECMFSKNRKIADTAASILEQKNYGSTGFLAVYRQTRGLIAQAWKGEVFSQDIEELVADSIETYKEGRFDQGTTNLTMARDLLEDRLEWHSHLRSYIKDVLKLTPVLSRSGVQVDSIQDSIRHLSSAIPDREYTEAKKLLELRRQETHLWKQLWSLEEFITKRVTKRPEFDEAALNDHDRRLMEAFVSVGREAQGAVQDGEAGEALKIVSDYIRDDVSARYLTTDGKRLDTEDEAAWYVIWSVGLGLLKLIAPVVPNVAEEFYQLYFRDREEAASVHTVPWPEPFVSLDTESASESTKARKSSRKGKGSRSK